VHLPLIRLPYFWDEAGYYIPAARDLFAGSLIPHSTPSNAHPPLVMAWLALFWKVFGQSRLVTRCALLLIAAFSLLGFFRLCRTVANNAVAIASTLLVAIYPVFFTQSSLAQIDLPATGFIFWGLDAYLRSQKAQNTGMKRRSLSPAHSPQLRRTRVAAPVEMWSAAIFFSLAALSKETAILVPITLLLLQAATALLGRVHLPRRSPALAERGARNHPFATEDDGGRRDLPAARPRHEPQPALAGGEPGFFSARPWEPLVIPILSLALWYTYHWARTGRVFGNPEFFRYNVQSTLHPWRIFLALLLRAWQAVGYLDLYVLTLALAVAMSFRPIQDADVERPRIAVPIQLTFLAIILVFLIAFSIIGGAVLARYMLPVTPLVILISVSTIWRRLRASKAVLAVVALAFFSALFINPPYGFSLEDNLAYRDYILLHQRAEAFLTQRYPGARVLTAWPASDELTRPYLGYVEKPVPVVRIDDFSAEQLLSAADARSRFDIALVFSTKYQPPPSWLDHWRPWQEWKTRYFDFHVDLPPEAAASILSGNLVYVDRLRGQWVGIVELERFEEASNQGQANFGVPGMRTGAGVLALPASGSNGGRLTPSNDTSASSQSTRPAAPAAARAHRATPW